MHKVEKLSDQELLKEMIVDNFQAFTELYNRYKHLLYQFIIRLSHGDHSMAEEIVQETFIIIWENRKKISIEYSFQSYLKKVSRNLFLKETSKRINEELMIARIGTTEKVENCVDNEVELKMLLEEVERVISLLPPARQNVYRLKHLQHLSQKEIANKLGISENTVESHLKQSTKFLEQMLKASRDDMMNGIAIFLYPFFSLLF